MPWPTVVVPVVMSNSDTPYTPPETVKWNVPSPPTVFLMTVMVGPTAAFASGTGAKTPVNMDITKDSTTSIARTFLMRSSPLGCVASIEDNGDVRGHKPAQTLV